MMVTAQEALSSGESLVLYCKERGIEIETKGEFGLVRVTAFVRSRVGGVDVDMTFARSGHDANQTLCEVLTAAAWQGRWDHDGWVIPLVDILNDDGDIRLGGE